MPMDRNSIAEPIDRAEFHNRLRAWNEQTGDRIIGEEGIPGVTPWLFIRSEGKTFKLHADTTRRAVDDYLKKVALFGEDLDWHIVPNQRGNENAVGFGEEKQRVDGLYLYLIK